MKHAHKVLDLMAERTIDLPKIEILCGYVCDQLRPQWVAFVCRTKLVWVKVQFGGDLHLGIGLLLCIFIISNVHGFCMVSKVHIAHLDMLMQCVQTDPRV